MLQTVAPPRSQIRRDRSRNGRQKKYEDGEREVAPASLFRPDARLRVFVSKNSVVITQPQHGVLLFNGPSTTFRLFCERTTQSPIKPPAYNTLGRARCALRERGRAAIWLAVRVLRFCDRLMLSISSALRHLACRRKRPRRPPSPDARLRPECGHAHKHGGPQTVPT